MPSGKSAANFRRQILAVTLLASAVSFGQQKSEGSSQAGTAHEPASAGQPVPDAAVPVSEAASPKETGSNQPKDQKSQSQDTPNQSALAKLGPGDLIEVNVYNVPELATKARVSNSGDIYLPLIDYVHVEGLTQEEAQGLIEKRLADGGFVRSPHVTIFIDDASSQGITLLGEISKPGVYPESADHKLYTIISEAGGFTASASRKIAIIRKNQAEPIRIDLPRNLSDDLTGDVDVQPGDTINVPKAPIIYVVGDVGRPSGFLVDQGTLTVLQAIALAGGTNRTAKMGGVRIIRKTPSGMMETPIQLKKMLEAKAPDVTLQADDILFVPISAGRLLAGRSFEAAMSLATAVTIYSIHP